MLDQLGAHGRVVRGRRPQAKRTSKLVDWARPLPAFVWSLRTVAPGGSLTRPVQRICAIRDEREVTRSLMQARCDRGAEIARKLGFSDATAEAIRALDEHWDGRGQPRGCAGRDPVGGPDLCLAQTVEVFHATRGVGAAIGWREAQRALVRSPARRCPARLPRRHGLLGIVGRAGPVRGRAARPDAARRRESAGSDRRGVWRNDRRQVAMDPSAIAIAWPRSRPAWPRRLE